jgi:hypothetical protein
MPKTWDRLSQYDRDVLTKVMSDVTYERVDQELKEIQEVWIKMGCIILDEMGLTEEQLLQFIAAWKRMYRRNQRIETKEEQTAWLDRELARCFQETGFPQFRIDEMKEM